MRAVRHWRSSRIMGQWQARMQLFGEADALDPIGHRASLRFE